VLRRTSTINTHLSALRSFCAWLHDKGHVEANPASRLKLVGRAPLPAPKALTDPQVNTLLRAAARTRRPTRDTAIVQLLLQTGVRIGEAAALRLGDIQFGEKRGVLVVRAGKGNKARNVPLNGSARQALADYLAPLPPFEVEPTLKAVAGAWPKPRHRDSLLPDPGGRPIRVVTAADAAQFERQFLSILNGGAAITVPDVAPDLVVTFTDEGCAYTSPAPLRAGELVIEIVVEDTRFESYALVVGTLDAGKTVKDLQAWPSMDEPPWFNYITHGEARKGGRSYFVAEAQAGPLHMGCLAASPDTKTGALGPIEVLP
jgi:hypothetical protein